MFYYKHDIASCRCMLEITKMFLIIDCKYWVLAVSGTS